MVQFECSAAMCDLHQRLRQWGFMLHMHTSTSAALSSFIIRRCHRAAIGVAWGAN
jgi:hypothetical protein